LQESFSVNIAINLAIPTLYPTR